MLAEKLYNLDSFKKQYEAIQVLSVCKTIPDLVWEQKEKELEEVIDWNNAISIASGLVNSSQNNHLDAALRISQTVLEHERLSDSQKLAAAYILISLTNNPAIDLAIKKSLLPENFYENFSTLLKLEVNKLKYKHAIMLKDNLLHLNKFQYDVFEKSSINSALSVSAPTSAGKSFILCNLVVQEILKENSNIIYVVPTRALISQVEFDLREIFAKYELDVSLSTVPQSDKNFLEQERSKVFVFTQERLHWFLSEHPNVKIDMMIVDEAHKIEDSYRGILLQQKIEEVISSNPKAKIFFSSPFTSNPEVLLDIIKTNIDKEKIITQFVSVNQNLIFVKQYPRNTKKWVLSLCLPEKSLSLGYLELEDRPTDEKKKMSLIASSFASHKTGNIIYANGAAEAEKLALALFNCSNNKATSSEVENLIKLTKKTIHSDYRLGKVLEKRIAFHYGNMPLLIRQEIERLFKCGEIEYLICTSTLLEGVNLPAKSIFIKKPRRGKTTPLNQSDFWNLAGRAGRWGKEFSGNIVCIEPAKWDIPPNPNKTKQKIVRALQSIDLKQDEFLNFIAEGSPRKVAQSRQDLEFAFGYYYSLFLKNKLKPENDFFIKLLEVFEGLRNLIKVPDLIIGRNPGISPIAQQNLLDYFNEKKEDIESLIPVYPEDENAYEEYIGLIGRIGKTLSFYPYELNASRSILIMNWISGKPLSYIISQSYNSYKNKPKYVNVNIHTVIREVMDSVEDFARFRFAKDSGCYIDILRYFLQSNGRQDLYQNIPQLNLWLEFGVSQKTHLSLLSLGLSRNTVVEISQYISNTEMKPSDAVEWILSQDLSQFDLSPIILDDIREKIYKKIS